MNNFIQAYSWLNIRYLLEGLWITVEISAISIVLSFIIGGLLGLLRYVKIKYLSALVGFVIDIIRNLPLLLILFFTFFGLPNIGIKPDVVMAAILAMTVFESAMVAEIIRSGIQAVDPGQMEAARSNGMSYRQAMQHIILPQAIPHVNPSFLPRFYLCVIASSSIPQSSTLNSFIIPLIQRRGVFLPVFSSSAMSA